MKALRKGVVVAALPGLAMMILFYSLAIHMRYSLGAWPTAIGEQGFSYALLIHSTLTEDFFSALFISLFLLPIPILTCLLTERARRFAVYFAVYGGVVLLCFALTQFAAPAQFLDWWRD